MEYDLKNKLALITGGANGIGLSIATSFLQKGAYNVILVDINKNLGAQAIEKLNYKFGDNKAVYVKCDITKDLDETYKRIIEKYNTVDILVNSAGITDEFDVQRCFDINTVALINWTYKFYEHMRQDNGGKGGTIINIASALGIQTTEFMSVYSATKFAIVGFSKSLGHAYHFKRTGVRVIAICPGATDTVFFEKMMNRDEKVQQDWIKLHEDEVIQSSDAVAQATVEVYKKSDSGTAWLMTGSTPLTKVQ